MKKPKKITVKFFLNKAVQPVVEGKDKRYPLYMLITYNRKNTMMKSHYGGYYKNLEEAETQHYPGFLDFEERNVQKAIRYEISRQGDRFDLKGIYKKYEAYCMGIHVLFAKYLKEGLWTALMRTDRFEYVKALNFEDPSVPFEVLYDISRKIFTLDKILAKEFIEAAEVYNTFNKLYQASFFQYTFPTIIEWLDQSAQEDYRNKLQALYKRDPEMIEKSISIINKVVYSNLEV